MEPKTQRLANLLSSFYLSKQAEGDSPNTIIEYRKDFAHFARWSDNNGNPDPSKLTSTVLKAFPADLRTQPSGMGKLLSLEAVNNGW